MKLLLIILIVFVSCKGKEASVNKPNLDSVLKKADDISAIASGIGAHTDSIVKVLLIQYYKAGWMDGSNGVIELDNAGIGDNYHIEKIKKLDWRKMENQVNSK